MIRTTTPSRGRRPKSRRLATSFYVTAVLACVSPSWANAAESSSPPAIVQETRPTESAPLPPKAADASPTVGRGELVERMWSESSRLRNLGEEGSGLDVLKYDFERAGSDYAARVDRIQHQLSRLHRTILRQRKQASAAAASAAAPVASEEAVSSSPHPDNAGSSAATIPETPSPQVEVPQELKSALAVTDKPVDRLALANNLYAMGQVELAAQVYAQLLEVGVAGEDRVWIQYQLAGCWRRNGNVKQAEKLYRTVAGSTEGPYWVERARWWLEHISRAERYANRRTAFEEQLAAMEGKYRDDQNR